jgi:cytochrome c biogenesis protein CcmG, thiol:disulfide interchange protein DsbE
MTRNRTDLGIKVAIGALLLALVGVIYHAVQEPLVAAGDQAPEFTVTTDQGVKITPTSFPGKVLVLNFWATWCAPCVEELPSLELFQREFANSGVTVVGVSTDRNEVAYKKFLQRFRVSFQTARDPEADIAATYGTYKFPETYIIGRDGKVLQKIIGPQNWMSPQVISSMKGYL